MRGRIFQVFFCWGYVQRHPSCAVHDVGMCFFPSFLSLEVPRAKERRALKMQLLKTNHTVLLFYSIRIYSIRIKKSIFLQDVSSRGGTSLLRPRKILLFSVCDSFQPFEKQIYRDIVAGLSLFQNRRNKINPPRWSLP